MSVAEEDMEPEMPVTLPRALNWLVHSRHCEHTHTHTHTHTYTHRDMNSKEVYNRYLNQLLSSGALTIAFPRRSSAFTILTLTHSVGNGIVDEY
jgi:hypothetical protein